MKRRQSRNKYGRAGSGFAVAALSLAVVAGCADLGFDPAQVPTSMAISPKDTLIIEGHPAKLTLQVFDQDGNLMEGPPSWSPPEWRISDPGAVEITWDGNLTTLKGADVRVIAKTAGLETWTGLRVNPESVGLSASVLYVNQVIQNARAGVPIIAGRPGYLRVFMIGDEVSFYEPRVLAEFVNDGRVVHTAVLDAASDVLPENVQEDRLDRSFNAIVPGHVLQPGVGVVLELDIDGVVPKKPGTNTRVPSQGTAPLNVLEMPVLRQVFVPVLQSREPDERVLDWTRGAGPDGRNSEMARKLLPVGEMEVVVQEPFTTTSNLRSRQGWDRLIRQVRSKWELEGREGYYYGAVQNAAGFAVGGLGYVGFPVSVGVAHNAVYAHELGHNMGLSHAPCGGAGGPDPNYPYDGGSSGQWGYDVQRGVLISPKQYKDLMGYCSPDWVSDYHFVRAMDFRLDEEGDFLGRTAVAEPSQVLMLWGGVSEGQLEMDPAFLLDAPVSLPNQAGPYRLRGLGPGGEERFALSFSLTPLEFGGGSFHFAVPYDPRADGPLDRVVLVGPEGVAEMTHGGAPSMAMVRDRETGTVRAFLGDWNGGGLGRIDGGVDVVVSTGLPGEVR